MLVLALEKVLIKGCGTGNHALIHWMQYKVQFSWTKHGGLYCKAIFLKPFLSAL